MNLAMNLKIKKIKSADVVIKNGGHFMTYKQPELICKYIVDEIQKINKD